MGDRLQYERFLWFHRKVKARRYPNATTLAEKFEISLKTAQRAITFMKDRLQCPLAYDHVKKGYFYEDAAFSLPAVNLSSSELSSLIIARRLLQDISGGYLAEEIDSAVEKISSIITQRTSHPEVVDELISFHLIEYAPTPEDIFRTLVEACISKNTVLMVYATPARVGASERLIDPYHLFNYMGTWHIVGYCHRREEIRDFRINRIERLSLTGDTFSVRDNFSFEAYFLSSFGLFKGKESHEVLLRFTPEKTRWIDDQIWHKEQKTKALEDGSLELRFSVADFSEIAREVLKHGSGVEVIQPESLRRIVREEAEKILRIYKR